MKAQMNGDLIIACEDGAFHFWGVGYFCRAVRKKIQACLPAGRSPTVLKSSTVHGHPYSRGEGLVKAFKALKTIL